MLIIMTSLCQQKLRIAGALAFIATSIVVACGVPNYNVPSTTDAGGIVTSNTGGTSGISTGGATSNSSSGGATISTGGAPQELTGCTSDANCASYPATKICDTTKQPTHCVECMPGPGEIPCGAGLYCGSDEICHVGCATDADCGSVACDASKCAQLTCDTTTHQCKGCTSDADCAAGTECDPTTAECVPGCGTSTTCPTGWKCCAQICSNPYSDPINCGYCSNACPASNATAQCLNGTCGIAKCNAGYADCDKQNSNGCEVNLTADSSNCGGCGTACTSTQVCKPAGTSGTSATTGVCGEASCTGAWANCDTTNPDCETNTDSNVQHCGSCAVACSTANGTPSCNAGVCTISCNSGFGDCNNNVNDGCEATLSGNVNNCGACGAKCTNDHGSTVCSGTPPVCAPTCGAGFADCDGNPANGCEATTTTDINNCGGCGKACNLANATASCTSSSCTVASCNPGYADCDGNPANGCEVNLQTNASYCGSCSTPCSTTNGTPSCSGGKCSITCAQGFADCDANAANGCEVNLNISVDNCATCGHICPDEANGTATCKSGVCGISTCASPFADCDGNSANGCEANTNSDPNNCGGCGNNCNLKIPNATPVCNAGICGIGTCNAGFADCDGVASNGCEVNLNTDINNCSACGSKCAPANAVGSCVGGACKVTSCTGSFQDCDGIAANGCEADTTTNVANCGSCKNACSSLHGTPGCSGSACSITCAAGFGNCDGNVSNGCEATTTNDASNCGTCGTACLAANGTASCVNSACIVSSCSSGFADCNGKYADGCEARLTTDAANCGTCGNICNSTNGTASCANSQCSIVCSAGYGNCDALASTGCEINLATSMQDCGTCGQACAPANATGACSGGACSITTCNTGFGNCNATVGDGCEANLTSDPNHCGTCTTVCSFTNAAAGCNSGVCVIGTCNAGFANCDGSSANGCEVNLTSDPNHCNSCSTVCAYTNASATCNSGACTLGTCNAGFANCDGNAANGCEVNLSSDVNNCNACGTKCPTTGGTPVCTSGTCGYSSCGAGLATCPPGATCATNTTNDVNNCGGCGTKCSYANAAASCVSSACTMGTCTAGYGNCDASTANGCEVNLKTDVNNCNACGTKCSFANASATCNAGTCTMGACNAGFADCDGNAANGCEVNLKTDINNCNACGTKCSTTNGTATCNAGTCQIACNAGYGDCDNNAANGCEVNFEHQYDTLRNMRHGLQQHQRHRHL